MRFTDGAFPFGSLVTQEPRPRLVDAPEGASVRIRFHQRDIVKAFIRYKNGDFSVWSLDWVDPVERTLKLRTPIANIFWHKAK